MCPCCSAPRPRPTTISTATPPQAELHLLAGSAGTGKTAHLAARYAACLEAAQSQGQVPRGLWLTPHRLAGEQVRGLLVDAGLTACLDPNIKTIGRLAEAVVSLDSLSPALLPQSATRWLVEQSIAELLVDGTLQVTGEAATRPGLADAVEQMIGELKARGVTAERFGKWAAGRRGGQRDRELAAIYQRYQRRLDESRAADRYDITRLACESLERSTARWDLLVVDGFSSFAYYERQLLVELVAHSREAWIGLATDNPGERIELTGAAERTRVWLEGEFPQLQVELAAATKSTRPPALAQLAAELFVPPSDDAPAPPADTSAVTLVHGADHFDEAVQVARRIKAKLTAGVPARDVVVAIPGLEAHRRRLAEVFETFGIPAAFSTPPLVGDSPAVRALLSVLQLEADDWPFRRVVATLGNHQLARLDGAAPSPWRTARGATEWLVRELQIAKHRERVLEAVQRLAIGGAESERPTDLQRAAAVAQPILAQLAAAIAELPARAAPSAWVAACEQLAVHLQLVLEPQPPEAWRQVREAAVWIERTAASCQLQPVKWTLQEWTAQLRGWMTRLPSSIAMNEEGHVRVYGMQAARFASAPHLYVYGLDESAMSTVGGGGGLYRESQYDTLVAADSSGRAEQATPPHQRAMQLFYDVVRGAQQSLTFSFAALDNSGQPTPASPMLTEACRTLGPALVDELEQTPNISPLPPADELPHSLRDWRLLGVSQVEPKETQRLGGLLRSEIAKPASQALAHSIAAMHHRARGDSFGPLEGVMGSPVARAWFAQQFGESHQWSTSQLETYATCPFKFFMKNVLGIAPLGDVRLETDHSRRGSLLHRALAELHAQLDLLADDRRQPSKHDAMDFHQAFADALATVREQFAGFGIERVLTDLLACDVEKWGERYYDQHAKYDALSKSFDEPLRPQHFELRFGKASRHADDDEAAASTDEPYRFELADGSEILIGGRIDRVDIGRVGSVQVFQIIDYKSAAEFTMTPAEVHDGRKLQPAVYALAAAQILSTSDGEAIPLKAGYWVVRKTGFGEKSYQELYSIVDGEVVAAEGWKEVEPIIRHRVQQLVEGVRSAEFPMFSPVEECTRSCDYSHVCRVAQSRSLNKQWPPPEATKADTPETTPES